MISPTPCEAVERQVWHVGSASYLLALQVMEPFSVSLLFVFLWPRPSVQRYSIGDVTAFVTNQKVDAGTEPRSQ